MPSSLDDYEVLSTIGTGSYGTCKKIRRKKDGKVLVWKELEYGVMSETEKQMLVAEVNLLRELKHRHIVRYYDRIIDRTSFKLYIIMEYCEGGDLAQRINKAKKEGLPVDEEFAWRICTQVVSALSACHSITETSQKKILHRDLKPANVFLDSEDNVKLGDFGLARVLNHDTSFAKTFVGTPYYMSPEQMNYLSYNEKSDIWSLGCLLYELCALRPPFTAANQRELATRICDGRFTRIPMRYSDELNDIVKYMLQVDEFKRPSIHDVSEHPLVLKYTSRLDTGRLLKDRRSSTGSDEGYNSRLIDSLKKREELLAEKERELLKKETDLKVRENNIARREKQAEDRMNRAEKLLTDYAEMKIIRTVAPRPGRRSLEDSDDDFSVSDTDAEYDERPKSSCLARKKPMDSPKKQVSFCMDKENDLYSIGLPDDNAQEKPTSRPSVETKTQEKRRSSAGSKTAAKLDKGYSRGREPSTGKYSAKAATTLGKDLYKPDTDLNRDLYKIGSDFTTKGMTSDYTRISSEFDKLSPRDHLLTETRLQQAHTKHMNDLRDRLRRAEIRSSELRLGDYQSKYSPVYTQQTLGIR